jgi:hypothetical protein
MAAAGHGKVVDICPRYEPDPGSLSMESASKGGVSSFSFGVHSVAEGGAGASQTPLSAVR